jgi:hypothetical protein
MQLEISNSNFHDFDAYHTKKKTHPGKAILGHL